MKNKFGILILISIFALARYNYLCVIQQINTNQYKSYTYNKPRLVTLFANAFIVGLATSKCGGFLFVNFLNLLNV